MASQKRLDLIGSLVCIGVGVAFVSGSFKYGNFRAIPNAGLFPLLGGICLIVFSSISLISAVTNTEREKEGSFFPAKNSLKRLLVLLLSLVCYVGAIMYLGFPMVTFLFMVFLLKCLEQKSWLTTFAVSFSTMVICYVLFQRLLAVQLPHGTIFRLFQ